MPTSRNAATAMALALCLAAAPARAEAREAPYALALTGAGGAMVTDDQRGYLGLAGGGGFGRLELRARPLAELGVDWVEGELRGGLLVVGPGIEQPGGLVDLSLGIRVAPRLGDVRPYLGVGVGLGFTGSDQRPVGTALLGLAFFLIDELTLAPELELVHVIQPDGPHQSSDAIFVALGLSLTYRPVFRDAPAPEVIERETTTERETTRVVREPAEPLPFEPAPPPPPPAMDDLMFLVDAAVCGAGVEIVELHPPVLFEHDEATLTASGEVALHDVLAAIAAAPAEARITIEGHADRTGTDDHNEALALARARTVSRWLASHGVPRSRLREAAEGARHPLVEGESIEALAPNRRVTVRIEHDTAAASAVEAP
jgi:outer membrane protein OmpA-like peptidoglycan-associated protein